MAGNASTVPIVWRKACVHDCEIRPRSPARWTGWQNAGIDVFHLCDSEFNVPGQHARRVCAELIARGLGRRVRWYAYLAVLPFDASLARQMRLAGCVGINFTGDAASATMLGSYRQPHRAGDLASAVRHCRDNGIAVMVDLLLGGPGETPQTVADTIGQMKHINPDCIGAGLGVRLYPCTPVLSQLSAASGLGGDPRPSSSLRWPGGSSSANILHFSLARRTPRAIGERVDWG